MRNLPRDLTVRYCPVIVVVLLSLVPGSVFGQVPQGVTDNINRQIPNPLPPSPNVASLGKFGDYKVSYFTGIPDISISIYDVKSGKVSVPITLSYHPSGVKPTDLASWVGTGWALSAGGQVSRSVRGKPDEVSYRTTTLRTSTPVCGPAGVGAFSYLKDITRGIIDTDPDIFSYSYPGGGGKFVVPKDESPYLIPFAPVNINPFSLDKFEITNEAGVLYKFGTVIGATEATFSSSGSNPTTGTTAWLLTDIIEPNSNDQITFSYQGLGQANTHDVTYLQSIYDYCYTTNGGQCPSNGAPVQLNVDSNTSQKGLQTILFENGKVEFTMMSGFRRDQIQLHALDSITLYSKLNGVYSVEKSVKFVYSYFKDVAGNDAKLKLDAVYLRGKSGGIVQRYAFSYFTDSFPWTETGSWLNQRDLWGYYNGDSNTNLIAPTTLNDYQETWSSPVSPYTFGGATDRNVNTAFIKHGVLKRIDFPTGGYTEFDYESNKYFDVTAKLVGGLRVTKMTSNDGNGSPSIVKTYKYGASESGYGTANFTPWQFNYFTTQRFYSDCESPNPTNAGRVRTFYSNSAYALNAFDNSPILYPYVTEYTGDAAGAYIGKTIFEYDGGVPAADNIDQVVQNTGSYYKVSFGWTRGKMTKKSVYSSTGDIVSESEYFYTLANTTTAKLIGIGAAEYVTGNNTCSYDLGSGGFGSSCTNDINEVVNTATYFSQPYTQNSGIYLQTKAYETTYENGTPTKFVRNTTETTYTTNTQAKTTKVTKGSSLEQTVTVNTYPYELTPNGSSTGSAKGVYLLNTKHILTNPIETFSYLQGANGTNQRIISGQVVTFKENATSTGKVVADSIYLLEGSLPFVKSAYTPVSISGNNSWIVKNSNYKARLKLNNYDSDGNLLTLAKINDISTSYLYGYANSVPIAKITNATLTEYLHENFEELAPSGTIINSPTAHTGKQYYNGDYTVNFTKPNGRTYTVDYWYYDTKWNYISKTFTGTSMSLTEGTRIDNVRIYPSDAQMTTYTYDILNGMTSMADTNGRVEYYEYDPFGRLLLTRDSDGNITKAYKYHYREE